ncbi:acetyl/propionyl/methylcrotonyl-CoA carboxylase subunit alpha [Bifidobacterium myosotis]|uniref:biotin carboxylase n=1 Tax=Bifidobacterium myosotis TaxID=1630166 RepID=A0A5M9ZLJ1_9BIFI|nr:biotin carboxylase N-terminal domain-containing protein [Bifidobacterium myosotis]KAA8828506.1 biotin/lipoyl-binding protein [Bifidobacterium myosotis]
MSETRHIQRILIANRGEIAVRVIHACQDTGRTAIAVYADPDVDALFVHLADEAYALGGGTSRETYLNIGRIIDVARRAHADAVHPGYGFLSENADFAEAVIAAGMVWIGPSPETIRELGSKVQARRIAADVGAPMAPGTTEPVRDPAEVVAFAREHGLPLAIKAVYGGGGRGLKVVHELADVEEAFVSATHEAQLAFGNGDCFIERFLARPRHVEVQVLGDAYGHVEAVGTRDCSLQRRNQKLIEEAPAPFLPADTERRLRNAAVAICERARYTGAGTVEFLVDPDGTMSFMEVNTRIQVEHPVTEMTCGVDLVEAQLAIAEGTPLEAVLAGAADTTALTARERSSAAETSSAVTRDASVPAIRPHGHAIEFRINAEDPARGFVPFPGTVTSLRVPTGPGIRWDSGVAAGSVVPDQFDSMLAKLVVWAPTRDECLLRAKRALAELEIGGVPTVKAFDQAVLAHPDFAATDGRFAVYTRWIEEEFLPTADVQSLSGGRYDARAAQDKPVESWVEVDGKRLRLGLPASFAGVAALGAGLAGLAANATANAPTGTSGSTMSTGTTAIADAAGSPLPNSMSGIAALLAASGSLAGTGATTGANAAAANDDAIAATISGTVVRWLVDDGAQVQQGDPVVVLEAMKMETEVSSPASGTLHQVATVGASVRIDQPLGTVTA